MKTRDSALATVRHSSLRGGNESPWSARAWAIYLGWIVITLDGSALNLALPAIGHEFSGESVRLAWTVDAYTLPLASLLLLGGSLGDRIGTARLFRVGAVGFAVASAGCALAPTLTFLVACRALQGVFAAAVVPMILAMVATSFTQPRVRARAINLMTVFGGAGMAVGPFLGGLLTDTLGWRYVFWLTAPFAVLAATLVAPGAGRKRSPHKAGLRVDLPGQIVGTMGLVLLVAGLIQVDSGPDLLPWILLGSGALALVLFVLIERGSRAPMLPLSVFAVREFRWVVAGGLGLQLGSYGMLLFLAVFLQHSWGMSALLGGLLLAPVAIGIVLSSALINPRLIARGPSTMIVVGSSVSIVGAGCMLLVTDITLWPLLAACCFVIGIGGGIYSTGLNQVAGRALGDGRAGLASGIYNTSRQIGQSVGVALFGAWALQAAARPAFVLAMLVVLATLLLVLGCGLATRMTSSQRPPAPGCVPST